MNAIETSGITKKFGSLTAVDDVSISVKQGEIFGLLGPNGAGKTTLISMLVTMKRATSGEARVNGFDVLENADKVRESIGIVFQDPSLDEELTAYENLELHAAMYGVAKNERERRIRKVMETVELSDRLNDVVKTFSGGMRRRLEIARGLLHYPKIMFLDEPTIGLDPQTRKHVWDYIKKLKDEHKMTIVLTTHYLEEADSLCDRIAIIDAGKIIALDTAEALKNSLGGDAIIVETPDAKKLEKALKKFNWVEKVKTQQNSLNIKAQTGEKRIAAVVEAARKQRVRIDSIALRKPTLDDVFLHYTGKTIREENGSARDSMRIRMKAWGRGR